MTDKIRSLPLGELIKTARDTSELRALLATGETYLYASDRTKNRWRRLAARRVAQLKNGEGK